MALTSVRGFSENNHNVFMVHAQVPCILVDRKLISNYSLRSLAINWRCILIEPLPTVLCKSQKTLFCLVRDASQFVQDEDRRAIRLPLVV